MKSIIIIGGGLSGLSAACYLAKNNFQVTLIEKNSSLGGRLCHFEHSGFLFDMGPSWYWMPDVFENFFNDFNKKVSDYYTLKRLDPSYKFFFSNSELDIPANIEKLYQIFETMETGSAEKLKEFLDQAKQKYKISMDEFIERPNNSLNEYLSVDMLKFILSLDLLKSLRNHIAAFFKNKKLREILEFPSMFLGGTPNNTPALYSLMNHADIIGGTWYPMGGMNQISKAFYNLGKELGVKYVLNEEIDNIEINNNKIKKVTSRNGKTYISDGYISCAEYPHIQTLLSTKKSESYKKKYWNKKHIAPSALIFYLGLSKKISKLEHHNLFFDESFDNHLNDIFNKKIWPEKPLFYVCCPSKTDPSIVPDNSKENIFILIPISAGSNDTNELREKYYIKIINRLEKITGEKIKNKIIYKKSFCVNDFKKKYNSFKGNAYGLANTLFQTAVFKPKMKDKKIKNLYYTGHFTIPGPGLPPSVISGKIVSNQILKDLKK